jgi:hypothetical protein
MKYSSMFQNLNSKPFSYYYHPAQRDLIHIHDEIRPKFLAAHLGTFTSSAVGAIPCHWDEKTKKMGRSWFFTG